MQLVSAQLFIPNQYFFSKEGSCELKGEYSRKWYVKKFFITFFIQVFYAMD
jgi:hypothetical protein